MTGSVRVYTLVGLIFMAVLARFCNIICVQMVPTLLQS